MADGNILSDFGINILEEEIDDVIFQTNEFLTDATFTGSQGPFWWILQMCMALAALFAIVMAAGMAYKMMVKHEPLDVLKLFISNCFFSIQGNILFSHHLIEKTFWRFIEILCKEFIHALSCLIFLDADLSHRLFLFTLIYSE